MRILVTAPNAFAGAELVPGELYEVTPYEDGTERQNRAWHALVQEFWTSGCHSYDAQSFEHFRELIKLELGAGAERYYSLVGPTGIPMKRPAVRYRVKSWRDYTKKERAEAIDTLVATMHQAQVQTKKFYAILEGMEKASELTDAERLAQEAAG